MSSTLVPVHQRQLDLGPASFFRPAAVAPPANQISVKAGFLYAGGLQQLVPNPGVSGQPQDQLTAGFALVGVGQQRYDLVYLDNAGTVQIAQGTQVALGQPFPQGAPGWTGTNPGPALFDNIVPIAYVLITETAGSPVISDSRITAIPGFIQVVRSFGGYFIDKGFTGSVPATGSQVVTTSFTGETAGGSTTQVGVITTSPLNVVHLTDQNGDEIQHQASQEPIYGRITFSLGVWTLSYFYDNAGTETAVGNMSTDTTLGAGLTNIHMLFTPKVYSQNDPNRPLFASALVPLNGRVAGEIPYATTSSAGIVQLEANSSDVNPLHVVTANDTRLGTVMAEKDSGGSLGTGSLLNFIEGTNVTMTVLVSGGVISVTINSTASGGFPGFGGVPPADTPGGSAGSSGLASESDHAHPLSSQYALSCSGQANGTGNSWTTSVGHPRIAVGTGEDGTAAPIGVAWSSSGTALSAQASTQGGTSGSYTFGSFLHTTADSVSFTTWTSSSQTLSGSGSWNVTYFVLGMTGL